jgi:hypothetical protein
MGDIAPCKQGGLHPPILEPPQEILRANSFKVFGISGKIEMSLSRDHADMGENPFEGIMDRTVEIPELRAHVGEGSREGQHHDALGIHSRLRFRKELSREKTVCPEVLRNGKAEKNEIEAIRRLANEKARIAVVNPNTRIRKLGLR